MSCRARMRLMANAKGALSFLTTLKRGHFHSLETVQTRLGGSLAEKRELSSERGSNIKRKRTKSLEIAGLYEKLTFVFTKCVMHAAACTILNSGSYTKLLWALGKSICSSHCATAIKSSVKTTTSPFILTAAKFQHQQFSHPLVMYPIQMSGGG